MNYPFVNNNDFFISGAHSLYKTIQEIGDHEAFLKDFGNSIEFFENKHSSQPMGHWDQQGSLSMMMRFTGLLD